MAFELGSQIETENVMMVIEWLDDAVEDLEALYLYISDENPMAANHAAKRILDAVELLIEHPSLGRPGRVPNTRELVISKTPYIIPYCIEKKIIRILRVFHSAMQWPEKIGHSYLTN